MNPPRPPCPPVLNPGDRHMYRCIDACSSIEYKAQLETALYSRSSADSLWPWCLYMASASCGVGVGAPMYTRLRLLPTIKACAGRIYAGTFGQSPRPHRLLVRQSVALHLSRSVSPAFFLARGQRCRIPRLVWR